jgi:SAM-dependent methyltransferase
MAALRNAQTQPERPEWAQSRRAAWGRELTVRFRIKVINKLPFRKRPHRGRRVDDRVNPKADVAIKLRFVRNWLMQVVESPSDVADRTRAELADLIDLQMSPLGLAAMNALGPMQGKTILDVGCGAGQTTVQLAERTGNSGRVIGVDIAPRVVTLARARSKHLHWVSIKQADAAQLLLPDHSVDFVYSRFGVMFFPDPLRAFSNLRRMLRPGGRIGFVCWRSIRENELDFVPLEAAGLASGDAPHVSFEQLCLIEEVLRTAGFDQIKIDPLDAEVSCGDIDKTLEVVTQVGALGKTLRDTPEGRPLIEPRVRAVLVERANSGRVSLKAATWIVTASKA